MVKINWVKLIASIFICELVGILGSVFTVSSVSTWYPTLNKPFFNPPSWLFGPVWTLLYLLMGISLYLVWDKGLKKQQSKTSVVIFGLQLALNLFWSILFFGLRMPLIAFIEIILLWLAILLTIMHFKRISRTAAYLLIPYILWVSFAAALNFAIYYLN
jgi:tryptophan-rich sensory protein